MVKRVIVPKQKSSPVELSGSTVKEIQSKIENFPDIVLTNPQDGDVLTYDQAIGKWTNSSGIIDLGGSF
jgi:hypothetical protein